MKHATIDKAEMLEFLHFQSRPRKCRNCEDYLQELCKGHLFKDVSTCMANKAKGGEIQFFTNLDI